MQKEEEKESVVDTLVCPSFSTYSSVTADIADQVTREHLESQNDNRLDSNDDDHRRYLDDAENDFEFVAFRKASDEVFFEGYAGPVFPIFNCDLVKSTTESDTDGGIRHSGEDDDDDGDAVALQFPMRKLLISDEDRRRDPPSSSSSEVDDLDAIPAGTYCVWTPKSPQASPNRCKKSNSTGSSSSPSSSKRWKLLDLLRRSNSEGKDTFVFLTPAKKKNKKKEEEEAKVEKSKERRDSGKKNEIGGGGRVAGKKPPATVSAHESLYVRNREMRRVDKRRSFLPYKQDLVGFCASLNGMGRAFTPF